MITAGALSKESISFVIDHKYSPLVLRGIFTGHSNFFTIPPFDEKINAEMDYDTITFTKASGRDFVYEEISGIIKRVNSFSKLTTDEARSLVNTARDLVPATCTYFFPDPTLPYIELGFYYNWLRIDFHGKHFMEVSEKVKEVFSKAFENTYKVFSNNIDDITIYNWDNSCIMIRRVHFALMAEILRSFDLLAEKHMDQFNEKLADYAVKVYAFTEASEIYKKIKGLIAIESGENPNKPLQYFLELLSNLSKTGRIIDLEQHQQKFLEIMKDYPKKIAQFSNVDAIVEGIRNVTVKLKDEIEMASLIRPLGSEIDMAHFLPEQQKDKKPGQKKLEEK